jgi:septum formation protein
MLAEILKSRHIILASSSPRRQELIKGLGLDFEIRIKPVKEEYPDRLRHFEISDYLAQLKSMPFVDELTPNDILITSDTIVWHNESALGKPKDNTDAFEMLKALSGQTHEVITSVCFKSIRAEKTINSITKVTFKPLSDE